MFSAEFQVNSEFIHNDIKWLNASSFQYWYQPIRSMDLSTRITEVNSIRQQIGSQSFIDIQNKLCSTTIIVYI